MFYSLIRTVPCISGNITLACKLNNNTKIDRYTYISNVQSANLWPLDEKTIMEADSVYNINLKFNSLEFDIPKIYQYLNDDDLFYKEYKPSDFKVSDERNKLNEFGCRRISYKKHDNFQFMFFAPIYCDKFEDLPNIFLLKIRFFNDKNEEVLSKDIQINISKETKTNYLYLYLKNYLGKLNDNVMYIAPKSEDSLEFTYKLFGIDLVNSGFSTNEYIKTHTYIENPLNYDKSICYQWKDKKIVVKQIIPLSFVFNIDDFLSNYEKLYLRNMPFKISGSYINSNSKVFDLYDFDSDYTPNYCQELLKYNYNDLVIDTKKLKYYSKEYLGDDKEDIKKYNKEDLQKWIFENNYLDNKLSTQYFKWKLKLSSNDSPYIINENEIYTEQLLDKGIQHIAKLNFTNELLISNLMTTDDPNGYNLYFPNFCSSTLTSESLHNVYSELYYKYYDYNILYLLNILDKKAIKLNEYGYSQLRYVLNNKLLKQYIKNQKEVDKDLPNIEYSIDDLADELFIKLTSNDGEVYYELDSSKVEKLNINFNLKNIDYIIGDDDTSYNKVIDDINTSFINSFNYITNDFLSYKYNIAIQLNNMKATGIFPVYQNGKILSDTLLPCYTIYQDNRYKSVNLVNRDDFINIFINTLDNTIDVQQQLEEVLSIIIKNKNNVFYFPKIEFKNFLDKYVQFDNFDDSKKEQIINIFSYTKTPSTFNDQNTEHSQTITNSQTAINTSTLTVTHTATQTSNTNIMPDNGIYFNTDITQNTYGQLEKLNQSYRYLYTYFYSNIYYVLKKYQEFLHLLLKSRISKKLYSVCIYQFNTNKQILNYLSIYHDIHSNKVKSTRNSHLTNKSNKFTIDKISLSNAIFLFILYVYYTKDKENFTIVDDDSKKTFNTDIFDKLNKLYIFNDIKILGVNTISKANNEETNDDGKENFSNGFSKVFRKNKNIIKSLFGTNNDKDLIQFIKNSFVENRLQTISDRRLTNSDIDNIANKTVYYFYKYKKQYNKLLTKILYHTKAKYTSQKPAYKDSLKYKKLVQEFVNKAFHKAENSILSSMNLSYKQIKNNIDKLDDQKTYLTEV